MKVTNVKAMVAKVMTVGLLAGAFALAAPVKAEAQGFAVSIQAGYPRYDFGRRHYYSHLRFEQERRAAFIRQQEWESRQAFIRHEEWGRREAYLRHHDHDRDRFWR
jgi:hypothetical protein